MDIEKEREAFEAIPKNARLLRGAIFKDGEYVALSLFDESSKELAAQLNYGWEVWLSAKAQAVPQWISTSERMPDEGEEVLVHSLGQVRQVTRDSKWAGGFKERNCYGWQAAYGQSHWMPKSIELPEQYHFYYENDAKQKAMIDEVSQ